MAWRRSRVSTPCGRTLSSWTSRCRRWTASRRRCAFASSSRTSGFSGCRCSPRGAVSHAIELAGAAGFFVKGVDTQRLIQHLLAVHAARGARPRVLLADDHPGVVKALKRMLSFECDVVGVVADGSEVVEAAARLQPVVDVNLPNVNGLEVCRRILQTNPRAKVILITAMIDDRVRADALATGASGFFSKLAPGEELIESIRRMWAECSITAQSVPVEDRP